MVYKVKEKKVSELYERLVSLGYQVRMQKHLDSQVMLANLGGNLVRVYKTTEESDWTVETSLLEQKERSK